MKKQKGISDRMDCIKNKIKEYIEHNLKPKRLKHTYSVAEEAVKLAEKYGEDTEKAELAALCHDMVRNASPELLNSYIREFGLPERLENNVNLSHGKVAAELLKREYGVEDEDVINAVAFHTTGRAGMSVLEKIIFLADAIEPGRDYPSVEELRKTAYINLDRACMDSLESSVRFVREKGEYLDPDTLDALNDLKEKQRL